MGRYSTVQAYADNNSNMRAVSYEQATGSSDVKKGAVKAEKVVNPYGSTAGAGSGEFHVYRHARSREMERWKALDESEKEQKTEEKYQATLKQYKTEDEQRTEKRRKKRQREKDAKMRKKNLELSGVSTGNSSGTAKAKAPLDDDEEFSYKPMNREDSNKASAEKQNATTINDSGDTKLEDKKPAAIAIPNDGSFLEMMKKKLAAENAGSKEGEGDGADEEPPANVERRESC